MATMSAAEARLDAAIRPEILVLRSRSSYPVRHRPITPASSGPAGNSVLGALSAGAAQAGNPRSAVQAIGSGSAVPKAGAPEAGAPQPGAAGRGAAGRVAARRVGKPGPVKLTRRGRIVVAGLVAIVSVVVAGLFWLFVAGQAEASNHVGPGHPAGQGMLRVVVRPGQTLWEIALLAQPAADPRVVVQEIVDANSLGGPGIQVGEVLWVPRG